MYIEGEYWSILYSKRNILIFESLVGKRSREIARVPLVDPTFVPWPMNEGTRIPGIKPLLLLIGGLRKLCSSL